MNRVQYTTGSVLQERLERVFRNLYSSMNAETPAAAYGGVHPLGFAEPEFAGKYMDISAAYARNYGSVQARENGKTVVDGIIAGQRADGYLGGYAEGEEFLSFSIWNQAFTCFGLISYYKETQYAPALEAARRCMDYVSGSCQADNAKHFLDTANFGAQHLVMLLPAAQLFALTKEARYGDFCKFILDTCRRSPSHNIFAKNGVMGFGSPKGIETLAFLLGVCTYGELVGDAECIEAVRHYWEDAEKTFIRPTGCGTIGELWTYNRNLPAMLSREIKPNENCVAVGWMELSLMLYDKFMDGKYFDAFERTLYNHLFGSTAPDGSDFAYYQGNYGRKSVETSKGMYACCRFRGLTMFAHMPECAVFAHDDTIAFPLYASYDADISDAVHVRMRTEYPRNGEVILDVSAQKAEKYHLLLRIPSWCNEYTLSIDGENVDAQPENGHVCIDRVVSKDGVRIVLNMVLPIRRKFAQVDDMQCVSVEYGPLLLALDSHFGTPIFSTTIHENAEIMPLPNTGSYLPIVALETSGTIRGEERKVRLVDYASAGMLNHRKDRFRVWIPVTGEDMEAVY